MEADIQRLHLILKNTTEGWWEWNVPENLTYHSPHWFQMLGYEEGELTSSFDTWLSLIHIEERTKIRKKQEELMKNQNSWILEFRMLHKKGKYLDIVSKGTVVKRDENGKAEKLVGIHLDITGLKLLEKRNFELQKKIENQFRILDKISHKNSHELRAPVATILGITQILIQNSQEHYNQNLIECLYKTTEKLDGVIHEFNKFIDTRK